MMATSGWLMMGVAYSPPMAPKLVMVKVPPCISSREMVRSRAFWTFSFMSEAIWSMLFLSTSLTTGTIRPWSVPTATPML